MKILRESMTRIVTSRFVIRVWRQEKLNSKSVCKFALLSDIGSVLFLKNEMALAMAILKFPRVSAVEVLDVNGEGEVLYKNRP